MVELTTVHHGSDDGDPPVVRRVDISFADDFPAGLDVDLHRAPPWTELLAQGTSDPVGVRVGQLAAGNTPLTVGGLYRAVAPALGGAVLAERIVTGDDTTWEIRAALLRTVAAADAPLDPGEIAFYGGINYGGGAVVIATSIPDVGRLPGFPGVVGSIRLGPNTAAELTSADHAGGVADFTMDQPTLAGTPIASGRLAGFTIERIANPTAYGITHRSDLVRHHQLDGSEISAYRVTITAPPSVTEIDVWTETVPRVDGLQHDSVPVSITWIGADGQEQTGSISAVDRQRLVPNSFGKVTFTIPGAALACPALEFRTNTMTQGDVLTIRPDATLHERIANLPDGDFHSHVGEAMGKDSETCAHVQQAIQNLARTVQHKVEPTPHGLAHVHDVGPEEMSHPHWQLDIDAGRFSPLTSEDLNAATQHAIALHEHHEVRTLDVFGQIGTFVKQATHVIVHTATAAVKTVQTAADTVAKDVDRTATQVAKDVQSTGANVANDIRTGDWAAAGADLERGTLSVTKDAVTGVVSVGGDVVNGATQLVAEAAEGAEQLAVVTLQLAGELLADGTRALGDAVQFVLSHTGVVGELIGGILHQIEVDIDKAAAWLRSEFHLDDVKQTADEIKNLIADGRAMIDRQVTSAFADLETTVGTLKERALAGLHHLEATPDFATHTQAALPPHHGEAQEKLDWLLSLFAAPAQQPSVSEPSGPYASAESPFDVAGTLTISSGLADLGRDLATTMIDLVADPSRAATDFGDMMGDVVEEIFGFAEDVLGDLFDGLSNTLADFATTPPSLAGVPLVGSLFGIGNAQDAAALLVGLPASVSYRAMTGKPLAASLADNQAWSVTERQAFSLLQVWAGLEAAAFVGFGSSRPDRRSELQVLAIARSVDLIGLACEWIAEHVDDGSPFDGGGDPGDGDATRSALDNAGEMDTIALWIGTVMFVGDVVGDGLVIQRRHKRRGLEIEERMSGEPREKPDTLRDTELKSFYEGVTGILRILAAVASLVFEVSAADQFVKNSPTSPYARYGHLDAVAKFLQEFCGALPDVMSLDTAVQVARRKATTEAAADAIDESLKTPRALLLGASNVALLGRIPGGPLF